MSSDVPDSITAINAEKTTITVQISKRPNGRSHELGRGANGVVYKGSHNSYGKEIAIKKFSLHPARNQGAYLNMVLKCAKSAESSYFLSSVFTKCEPSFLCFYGLVVHPSHEAAFKKKIIFEQVKSQAVFVTDTISENTFYLLYEYVNGRDLDVLLRESKGEINYRKHGAALLKALVKLRNVPIKVRPTNEKTLSAQMVHLDIKPSNMMIETETDTLKIIDLNTVCIPTETKGNGGCTRQSMTFEYAGPEAFFSSPPPNTTLSADAAKARDIAEAKEQRKRLFASDIFATGLTLYEMIMKKPGLVLEEHSIGSWLDFWDKKTAAGEELDLDYTPEKAKWAPLISRMVKRDYRERPTATQALADFNTVLEWEDGPGSVALPKEAGSRGRKSRKTRRRKNRK
jgi:serine/threonine protein kinase